MFFVWFSSIPNIKKKPNTHLFLVATDTILKSSVAIGRKTLLVQWQATSRANGEQESRAAFCRSSELQNCPHVYNAFQRIMAHLHILVGGFSCISARGKAQNAVRSFYLYLVYIIYLVFGIYYSFSICEEMGRGWELLQLRQTAFWPQTIQNPVSCTSELREKSLKKLLSKMSLKFLSTISNERQFIDRKKNLEESPF